MNYLTKLAGAAIFFGLCANASAAFVINEVDADTPGRDREEFVELKGLPGESADGLIIVLFDGDNGLSYRTIDLSGISADANGYLLIADAAVPGGELYLDDGWIQNQEDAVALYHDSASNFPDGSAQTTTNLQDVVVYESNVKPDVDWSGLGSPPVAREGAPTGATHLSVSRIPDGTGAFVTSQITPDAPNASHPEFNVSGLLVPRFNQSTAAVPTTYDVIIENHGVTPLSITSLELATTSSAQFTVTTPVSPSLPAYLEFFDTVTISLQFLETDVSANKDYAGALLFTTDNATSPSGSIEFSTELVISTPSPSPDAVMVNEVCYNPGAVDHNNDGSTADQNDEFVELVNMTSSPILIEGWEQRCTNWELDNMHSFVFPEGATIPANGFVTVFTDGNPTGFTPGTTFTYGIPRIRNSGAFVGISDGTTLLDGIAYGNAETTTPPEAGYTNTGVTAVSGGSIGRRPDGTENFRPFDPDDLILTDHPSPNATNNLVSTVSAWSLY